MEMVLLLLVSLSKLCLITIIGSLGSSLACMVLEASYLMDVADFILISVTLVKEGLFFSD